jgi:2-C-methyl-D-erythritol 2,4-cyclodiphosphate synthase
LNFIRNYPRKPETVSPERFVKHTISRLLCPRAAGFPDPENGGKIISPGSVPERILKRAGTAFISRSFVLYLRFGVPVVWKGNFFISSTQFPERRLMRIGIGYDVHRLVEGRRLVLGGVSIPHEKGLLGHSDADVVTHAVCDALLGAAGLGDIGSHFPDSDPAYQDADSLELLSRTCRMVRDRELEIINFDVTILAERPKIAPYREEMCRHLAAAAGIDTGRVNVKATSTEGLGWTGRKEGIGAVCVALLSASPP